VEEHRFREGSMRTRVQPSREHESIDQLKSQIGLKSTKLLHWGAKFDTRERRFETSKTSSDHIPSKRRAEVHKEITSQLGREICKGSVNPQPFATIDAFKINREG